MKPIMGRRMMSADAKLVADTKSTIVVATVLSLIGGAAWKYGYAEPVKRKSDKFYADYYGNKQ